MTTSVYFLPVRRIVLIAFPGVQTLDVTGPAEVFAVANRQRARPLYEIVVAARGGGEVVTSCSLPIRTKSLARLRAQRTDTVLVAGGPAAAITAAARDVALHRWLRRAAPRVQRIGSVCSGAFVLAAAGLLDDKHATTHWSACEQLARLYPRVRVEPNAIFVTDGRTWTSAGVTTGIDMALALVEADHDRALADAVAAQLVLYVRRPGYQSQWSEALVAQRASDSLAPAIDWAREHLAEADLEDLARRAGLSPRTFHRRCLAQLATTPAKLLDKLRVERARVLLTTSDLPVKALAQTCGWTSPARMTRAFERELGLPPRAYRLLHATSDT